MFSENQKEKLYSAVRVEAPDSVFPYANQPDEGQCQTHDDLSGITYEQRKRARTI